MRKSLFVFILTIVALTMSTASMAADAAPAGASAGVVNINTASAEQLTLLPRVGASTAKRIIEYRTQHGPFGKTADLMQVKGIGAKVFESLSPYLVVEGRTTLSEKVRSPRKPRAKKPANTASN